MMMQRKILAQQKETARQTGLSLVEAELIVPRANSLNNALLEIGETLNHILPSQEQSKETLAEKIKILETAQSIVAEGNVERLLGQIPEETKEYLRTALGLEWDKVGEYLTAENLEAAIQQVERQQAQLRIVGEEGNREILKTLQKYLLPLQGQTAKLSEDVINFRTKIALQANQAYVNQEIAVNDLLELSAQALSNREEYFIELTPNIEKVLPAENLPVIIYQNKKYLVCQNQNDRQLFNQAIVRAYLKVYENILINDVLHYNDLGRGVGNQEQNDLLTYANVSRTTLAINDTYRQIILFRELAILKYKYQDENWRYYQDEAQKILNVIKRSLKKKEFIELENELNKKVTTWAKSNQLEYDLPAPETVETEKRRAAPLINIDALRNGLRGLGSDPRSKPVLLIVLALFIVGGSAAVIHLFKNRQPEEIEPEPESESVFTRVSRAITDNLNNSRKQLVELFVESEKTTQEIRLAGNQIIQDARDQAGQTILSEEPYLTPEELSRVRDETNKLVDDLQNIIDTYSDARKKYDEAQSDADDRPSHSETASTLTTAITQINGTAKKYPESDTVVRPLAEPLSGDLEDRRQAEDALQEAEETAEAENQRIRNAQAQQANEAAEKAATAELENLWNGDLSKRLDGYLLQLFNNVSYNKNVEYSKKLQAQLTSLLNNVDANNTEQYFAQQSISTNSAKLRELKLLEDCAIYLILGNEQLKWGNSEQNILRRLEQLPPPKE